MEGASTTVYAQGGRGNARLVAWEGERTVTFTMEDALISPEGFMILSGAGLVEASAGKPVYQHMTMTIDESDVTISAEGSADEFGDGATATIKMYCDNQDYPERSKPYLPADKGDNFAYVMFMRDGEIISEPYIPVHEDLEVKTDEETGKKYFELTVKGFDCLNATHVEDDNYFVAELGKIDKNFDSVLVDFYVARTAAAKQIDDIMYDENGKFHLLSSVILMVSICLLNSLFQMQRFSLTSPLQWLLLVILQASPLHQTLSQIILVLITARKFLPLFKLLRKLVLKTSTVVLHQMVNMMLLALLLVLSHTKIFIRIVPRVTTVNFNLKRERDYYLFPFFLFI